MILAAGRGERMRPLTDTTAKPLLKVGGKALIDWHLDRLQAAGFQRVVVNHAWLGASVEAHLRGRRGPIEIVCSAESTALETAGGIANALPLIDAPWFAVINGDVFSDFDFVRLHTIALQMQAARLQSWSVLVANPDHHPKGDFSVRQGSLVHPVEGSTLTFSGIGLYHKSLFDPLIRAQPAKLAPLLRQAIDHNRAGAEVHWGCWHDVGTVERLQALDRWLHNSGL
jgi:MurNAc alpha-1-phosphate uridylyltransferase